MPDPSDSPTPDLKALQEAIVSGDPLKAMPALTELRFCTDEEAVPLLCSAPAVSQCLAELQRLATRNGTGWQVLSSPGPTTRIPMFGLRRRMPWPVRR